MRGFETLTSRPSTCASSSPPYDADEMPGSTYHAAVRDKLAASTRDEGLAQTRRPALG
jgi:hypothetical protein